MNRTIPAVLAVLAALALYAPPTRPAQAAAAGDLVREAVIDGPPGLVWRLLTTKRGMESWLAPHADVDLRVGGLLRTHEDPSGKIGDPKTLVNTITAIKPGRLLSLRVEQAPEGFPFANFVVGTWYDILVDPAEKHRTRVRCVAHGFGTGPAVYAVRPVFERGADAAFEQLAKAVAASAPGAAERRN
ncbi:MAG TPA: SRPBCC domain-containing protein [Candidatus Eisenbacteria bacterium]